MKNPNSWKAPSQAIQGCALDPRIARIAIGWGMAKPIVPPELLKAIAAASGTGKRPAPETKRPEASPVERPPEKQIIRPARTAIAHQRGGNKGK